MTCGCPCSSNRRLRSSGMSCMGRPSNRKAKAVVSQFDARRQLARDRLVLDLVSHVNQIGLLRLEPCNHLKGLVEREMRRVWTETQSVQDQNAQAAQQWPTV